MSRGAPWLSALLWLAGCGPAPPQNLLLISVDTLRPDHLEAYGYGRETSPAIARLAREGVLFERAYATSPATVASHASLFTGRLPFQHRTLHYGTPLPASEVTLAEVLAEQGWRTAAVATSVRFHGGAGFRQGFERYLVLHELPKNERSRVATDAVLELAAGRDERPFFVFVHYYGPHAPYWPPEPFRSAFHEGPVPTLPSGAPVGGGSAEGWSEFLSANRRPGSPVHPAVVEYLRALYDAEILFLDRELSRLLAGLDRLGLADDTLVVLVSDHGEEFKEHGALGHARALYEESLRIPLLMRAPRALPAGRRVASPISLVDVAPTVLELLGVPAPAGLAGRSRVASWRGGAEEGSSGAIVGQRGLERWSLSAALEEGRFKALFSADGEPELYALDADPGERHDLARERPALLQELRRAAPEGLGQGGAAPASQPVPDEVREQLRAIGYADEVEEVERAREAGAGAGAP